MVVHTYFLHGWWWTPQPIQKQQIMSILVSLLVGAVLLHDRFHYYTSQNDGCAIICHQVQVFSLIIIISVYVESLILASWVDAYIEPHPSLHMQPHRYYQEYITIVMQSTPATMLLA